MEEETAIYSMDKWSRFVHGVDLENSMDRGTWWARVHGIEKESALLSDSEQHSIAQHIIITNNSDCHCFLLLLLLLSHFSRV